MKRTQPNTADRTLFIMTPKCSKHDKLGYCRTIGKNQAGPLFSTHREIGRSRYPVFVAASTLGVMLFDAALGWVSTTVSSFGRLRL